MRFTARLDLQIVTADVAAIRKENREVYGNSDVDFKELGPHRLARPLRGM